MKNRIKEILKLKFGDQKKEERGIALIMTLGILSMLLVLALAFASNARTTRKIASSNANTLQARLIAEGALDRVLAVAKFTGNNPAGTTSVNPDGDGAFNYSSTSEQYNDFIYNISMNDIIGTEIYQWESDHPVEWINVTSDGEIVGRFAYKVIGNAGVIDPSATVTHDSDANANWGVAGAENENGLAEERFGVNVYEMNLGNLDPGNSLVLKGLSATQIKGFSSDNAIPSTGDLPDGTRWIDFSSMFTAIGISDVDAKKTCERDWLVLNTNKDPEAFWVDSGSPGDGIIDVDSELYHRFNLRQFTDVGGVAGVYDPGTDTNWWDDPAGDGGINGPTDITAVSGSTRASYDATPTIAEATGGINWLNDITNLPQETFASPAERRDQIVANLIDYCDSDDVPTSNIPPVDWATTPPTYTGNENTQYINEIYCTIESTQYQTQELLPIERYQNEYQIDVNLFIETVDIYNVGVDIDVYVEAKVKFVYINTNGSISTEEVVNISGLITSGSDTIIADASGGDFNTRVFNKALSFTSPWQNKVDGVTDCEVQNIKFEISNVWITTTGQATEKVDYSKIDYSSDTSSETITTLGPGGGIGIGNAVTRYGAFDFEVTDPRQNLNNTDWTKNIFSDAAGGAPALNTNFSISQNNMISDPSAGGMDSETVTSVVDTGAAVGDQFISTAFIANDLMVSPWELGAIHRGAAWQTLNLSTYNSALNMNAYVDGTGKLNGDGNILDQIKMTDDIDVYGKFNANTANKDCLRLLTMGIKTGNDYLNPTTGGTSITQTVADVLSDSINSATDHQTWKRRSQILQAIKLSDGNADSANIPQETDAQKEEIIGKFINLCKTSTENVSTADVIIVAQAIKDIGGPEDGSADITFYKDLDSDGALTGANETSAGYDVDGDNLTTTANVDEAIDSRKGRYDLNGDEILSEVKILAKIYYDTIEGKWRVSKYIFADE